MPKLPSPKNPVSLVLWILCGVGGLAVCGVTGLKLLMAVTTEVTPMCSRCGEGKSMVSTINRAQQAFYFENETFATAVDELDVAVESRLFKYAIVPQSDPKQAITTAVPAETNADLDSYIGFVFVFGEAEKMMVGTCKTDAPATVPPAPPQKPRFPSEAVECPPGSSLL